MSETSEQPGKTEAPGKNKARKKKPNGLDKDLSVEAGPDDDQQPEGRRRRNIVGCRLDPRALQLAVNVLKKRPWEDVADFMPALIKAAPIYADELGESKEPKSE